MKIRSKLVTGAAVAAAAVGGGAIASAASSSGSSPGTSTAGTQAPPAFNGPAPGTAAHEDAEKAVTGADATKAQDAAVKSVGSGTAGAVTTDYTGTGYEVTVTKSDGTKVELHLDSSFTGRQRPGGPYGGHGAPPAVGQGAPPAGSQAG